MKTHLNLLPPSFQRTQLLRRRFRQWASVLAVTVGLCAVLWCVQTAWLETSRTSLQQTQAKYAPTKRLLAEIPQMKYEMLELSRRDHIVGQLSDDHPAMVAMGLVSQSAAQCKEAIRVHQLLLERPATVPASAAADKPAVPMKPSLMNIQGTGDDNLAVAKFVVHLRATNAFQRVELKSSIRSRFALSDVQRFVVECEY